MTTVLTVTKTLDNEGWVVTAQLAVDANIPRAIFTYLNTGTNILGDYYGVLNVNDLARVPIWNSQALLLFGNKFVRHTIANLRVSSTENVDTVISVLKTSVQLFSTGFKATNSQTNIYTIT